MPKCFFKTMPSFFICLFLSYRLPDACKNKTGNNYGEIIPVNKV